MLEVEKAKPPMIVAVMNTESTPPAKRSAARRKSTFIQCLIRVAITRPNAWPRMISTEAVATIRPTRHQGFVAKVETSGMAKNAATPPTIKPSMSPMVSRKPRRTPMMKNISKTAQMTTSSQLKIPSTKTPVHS